MHRHPRLLPVIGIVIIAALAAAACTAGSSAPSSGSGAPSSGSGAPGSSPAATSGASGVSTAEAAFAAVRARSPFFDSIKRRDPGAIGQAAWWDATVSGDGTWLVTVEIGWGDCQAGCIDRHTWRWTAGPGGAVSFQAQTGPAIPDDQRQSLAAGEQGSGIGGEVVAGPTCPVERPGDSACAERPVQGAALAVQDPAGHEVATFTTDASGLFRFDVPAGSYTLIASSVTGLMGTARPQPVTVADGRLTLVSISYDTGIR